MVFFNSVNLLLLFMIENRKKYLTDKTKILVRNYLLDK